MRARHGLTVIAIAVVTLDTAPEVQGPPPLVTVGANVRVSAVHPAIMHHEGLVVADPTNARRLLVCSMFADDAIGEGIFGYASGDGGRNWEHTFQTTPEELAGDPLCTFGPDGTAYIAVMPRQPLSQAVLRVHLHRSTDGGHTWRREGMTGFVERASMVVDGTNGRFHNRIYIHGVVTRATTSGLRRGSLALYASADGGRTFGRPAERIAVNRQELLGAGNSVVLSDGRWVAAFGELKAAYEAADTNVAAPLPRPPELESAWVRIVTSDDGGDSMSEPATISGWYMASFVRHSSINPTLAADATQGTFRDRLYVVWPDTRFGGTDIFFSYSGDRGRTWSRPIVVNDDRRPMAPAVAPNHLLPTVAVNSAGVVGVAWLDRRDAPDNQGWRVRFRASLDGGETFQPSVLVSEAPARFDGREHWPTFAATSGGGAPYTGGGLLNVRLVGSRHLYSPGDYAGLAAAIDGTFFPYWIDNRTGWHQVWTAPITVRGSAIRNGSTDLAPLDDLTPSTALERVRSGYDVATQTASVVVRLKNTSKQTIFGPFKIRVISVRSDLAVAETLGSINGVTGPGAVWDALSDVRQLEPGAASRPITLTFHLRDVRPLIQGDTTKLLLVDFSARVLGRLSLLSNGAGR